MRDAVRTTADRLRLRKLAWILTTTCWTAIATTALALPQGDRGARKRIVNFDFVHGQPFKKGPRDTRGPNDNNMAEFLPVSIGTAVFSTA